MSILNLIVRLVSFRRSNTSSPQLNHFKWTREIVNVPVNDPVSMDYTLDPGQQIELFNALKSTSHSPTSQYQISHVAGNIYKIEWTGVGSAPNFRTPRAIGVDNTTQVDLAVDINTGIVTLTTPSGTPINTSTIVVGDVIHLSASAFAVNNAGSFPIIAVGPTYIMYKNPSATPQTVTLGSNYNKKLKVFSSAGVVKGDRVLLRHNTHAVVNGIYEITDVLDDTLFIFSTQSLPPITDVSFELVIFSAGKQLIYLESDKPLAIQINNVWESDLEVFPGKPTQPGIYLKKSLVYKLVVRNKSLIEKAKIYFASAE